MDALGPRRCVDPESTPSAKWERPQAGPPVKSTRSVEKRTSVTNRKTLLVGSIPADDVREALDLALDELGNQLIALPDGETGVRRGWVQAIINRLSTNPAVYLKKPGGWTSYEDMPRYRVRRGRRIDPASLDLGYLSAYQQTRPAIEAAAAQRNIVSLPLQVGMASAFDLALFSLGFVGALRHREAFNEAAARELDAIIAGGAKDVVFQIEIPAEVVMVVRTPGVLQAAVARWMGRMAVEVPQRAPAGTRFGIHLCYGDLENHSLVTNLLDCSAAVKLANSIVAQWPSRTVLEYVHIPFAAGEQPPPSSSSYYVPLGKLKLPSATRLVAGFVHEMLSEQQLDAILRTIESASRHRVDIAAACGLGRRQQPVARAIMRASRNLCEAALPQ